MTGLVFCIAALIASGAAMLSTSGTALNNPHARALYWLGLAATAAAMALVTTTLLGSPI